MAKSTFCDGLERRDFLRLGVLGLTGLALSDYLRASEAHASPATADACLFVNLAGGPSHLDTLDMKPEGPSETRGEFQPIASRIAGLQVCEHLPKFADVADRYTLIRGISHSAGAHPQAQTYMSTGNRPSPALVYPSLGSVAAHQLDALPDMPPYVAIPATEWTAGFLGDAYSPFKTTEAPEPGKPFQVRGISLTEGTTLEGVQRRQQLLKKVNRQFRESNTNSQLLEALDKFGQQAHQMITSATAQAAFDVSREPESFQKLFAPDELGQSLLLACRLLEHGVKFITVTNGGWDTHTDNFAGHKRLLGPLDAGLHGLIHALDAKGLLDRTLVVVMGEFGRTPKINENTGRDHYPRAGWCLMAGGGVRPGQLIGATDAAGAAPSDDTDIKPDDLAASIYHALGIPPRSEFATTTGRPVMLVPEGRIRRDLFG